MKFGKTNIGPLAIGAALIVGFLLFSSRRSLTSDEALSLAQDVVKSPDWRSGGLVNRPFSEYHVWEVEEDDDGGRF